MLFGYLVCRSLASPDAYLARFDLYLLLAAATAYAAGALIFCGSNERIAIVVALLAFGVVHVVFSVVQARVAENLSLIFRALSNLEYHERGAGLYINPDHLAGYLEVIGVLGLSISCWSRWPSWSRIVIAYLTGAVYLGLVLTGSRGGYLSGALSVICFLLVSLFVLRAAGKSYVAKFGSIGFVLFIAAAAATWIFFQHNPKLSNRAAEVFTPDRGRFDLWQPAVAQWQLNPIFGTGSGTYLYYSREFRSAAVQTDPGDVHNDYLNLLCDYGVVGLVAFVIFVIAHLREGWCNVLEFGSRRIASGASVRSDRLALNIGALSATAAYTLHSAVDFNLHVPANALVLAFVFGIFASTPANPSREPQRFNRAPRRIAAIVAALLLVQSARLLPGEYCAEEARLTLRDEHPKAAIHWATTALQHEQHNSRIFFYLGRAWRALGATQATTDAERVACYERAVSAFDRARELSPLDGSYPLELAMLYDKLGRFAEAEWMYEVALARDPLSLTATQMYQVHLKRWQSGDAATTR